MHSRSLALAFAALLLPVGAAGCGGSNGGSTSSSAVSPNAPEQNPAGDIPDNQAYVPVALPGGGVRVKVPEGWSRTTSGAAVAFTDKLNTIRIETTSAPPPRPAGAKVSTVSRTAGPAQRVTYLAQGPADPVTGKQRTNAVERYVFRHGGRDLVLTLSGPKGADNVDPWRIVTDSVRFTR